MGFIFRKSVFLFLNVVCVCYVSSKNHHYQLNTILVNSENYQQDYCQTKSMAYTSYNHQAVHQVPCKPRETMIKIVTQNSSMIVSPRQVWLNRCEERGCFGAFSCVPTKTNKVSIRIYQRNFLTGKLSCGQLMMEQHTACACSCDLERLHTCPENQKFKAATCKCACANEEEERECMDQKKIWDSFTCSCRCREKPRNCTTGSMWDTETCKCIIDPENSQVLYDEYFETA